MKKASHLTPPTPVNFEPIISAEEEAEFDGYLHVGNLLTLMKAKRDAGGQRRKPSCVRPALLQVPRRLRGRLGVGRGTVRR